LKKIGLSCSRLKNYEKLSTYTARLYHYEKYAAGLIRGSAAGEDLALYPSQYRKAENGFYSFELHLGVRVLIFGLLLPEVSLPYGVNAASREI
jgi:hypothetical protein